MGSRSGMLVITAMLLAACSPTPLPTGFDGVEVRTISLTMLDEARFEPDRLEVQQGETIRFMIEDRTGIAHEAFVGTAKEQAEHAGMHGSLTPQEQAQTSHFGYGVHIGPDGIGEIVYHFGEAGIFYVGCHYPGHYEAGMRVLITVQPTPAA